MKKYTDNELIRRVWEVEEIKKLAARRVYYQANDWREKELDELWVTAPEYRQTAAFGRNWGWYVGMDEVRRYYVTAHRSTLETQMRETGDTELNVGNLYFHPNTTGVVELAGDGKTARGLWYCMGQETHKLADGTAEARWIMGKLAMDFVKEEDGWKIWHIMIANDLSCEAGTPYSEQAVYLDESTDPIQREFGKPTIERLTHDATFNWWDNYPAYPEPYETFDPKNSYGPEGFTEPLGLKAGEGKVYA